MYKSDKIFCALQNNRRRKKAIVLIPQKIPLFHSLKNPTPMQKSPSIVFILLHSCTASETLLNIIYLQCTAQFIYCTAHCTSMTYDAKKSAQKPFCTGFAQNSCTK